MIQTILILLLIHYIGLYVYKPKHNILCCGLYMWAGKLPKNFNRAKFDILGLYNNDRGGDSCGVTTDGEIYYGLNTNKNYEKFIVEKGYENPKIAPTVIGHTRKSSVGYANEHNAHPFGYGEHNENYKFVFVHNGTLFNQDDLAKEFNVETKVESHNEVLGRTVWDRNKNDSEILGECIFKSGNIKVLNSYIGGAAIIFQDLTKPNVVYAFHGASRKEITDKDPLKYEERPLYYFREGKNSVYISSLAEPLVAIGGVVNKTVFELDHNIVYEITDGDIDNANKYRVNRNDAAQRKGYVHNVGFSMAANSQKKSGSAAPNLKTLLKDHRQRATRKVKKDKFVTANEIITNIYDETPVVFFKSGIDFTKLRYWRNGHLIGGIYTYVKDFGFYLLDDSKHKAIARSYELLDVAFNLEEGRFLNPGESPDFKSGNIIVPFQNKGNSTPPLYYFYQGIRVETELDYEMLIGKSVNFSFHDLSEMATHPIIDLKISKRKPDNTQQITFKKKLYSNKYSFLQSGKIYDIMNGNLISIEELENPITDEKSVIILPEVLKKPECKLPINTCAFENINLMKNHSEKIEELQENLFPSSNSNTRTEYFIDKTNPLDLKYHKITNVDNTEEIMSELENEDPEQEIVTDKKDSSLINKIMLPVHLYVQEANNKLLNEQDSPAIQEIIEINKDYLITLNEIVIDKHMN